MAHIKIIFQPNSICSHVIIGSEQIDRPVDNETEKEVLLEVVPNSDNKIKIFSDLDWLAPIVYDSPITDVNDSEFTELNPYVIEPFKNITREKLPYSVNNSFNPKDFNFIKFIVAEKENLISFDINGKSFLDILNASDPEEQHYSKHTEFNFLSIADEIKSELKLSYQYKDDDELIERNLTDFTKTNYSEIWNNESRTADIAIFSNKDFPIVYVDKRYYKIPIKFIVNENYNYTFKSNLKIGFSSSSNKQLLKYDEKENNHGILTLDTFELFKDSKITRLNLEPAIPNKNYNFGPIEMHLSDFLFAYNNSQVAIFSVYEKNPAHIKFIHEDDDNFEIFVDSMNGIGNEGEDAFYSYDIPSDEQLNVVSGERTIVLKKEGYQTIIRKANIKPGETLVITPEWVATTFRFSVELGDFEGITATLNGEPYTEEVVLNKGSEYRFHASREGYNDIEYTGTIEEDIHHTIEWVETRQIVDFVFVDETHNIVKLDGEEVTISGTKHQISNGIIQFAAKPNENIQIDFEHKWFEPFHKVVEIDASVINSDSRYFHVVLTRKEYKISFVTKPEDATISVVYNNQSYTLKSKTLKLFGGETFSYTVSANNHITKTAAERTIQKNDDYVQTIEVILEPVPIEFSVVEGTNSDLSNTEIQVDVKPPYTEAFIKNLTPEEKIFIPLKSRYVVTLHKDNLGTQVIEGEVTENYPVVVTINDWKLSRFVINLPENIENPVIKGTITKPGSNIENFTYLVHDVNDVQFSSVINLQILSSNYHPFTLEPVTIDSENVSIDVSNRLSKIIKIKEKYKISWGKHQVTTKNGFEYVKVYINEELQEDNFKILEEGDSCDIRFEAEGYNTINDSFIVERNKSYSHDFLFKNMVRKIYRKNVTAKNNEKEVIELKSIVSKITGKIYSVGLLENDSFVRDTVIVSAENHVSKSFDIVFNEESEDIEFVLEKRKETNIDSGTCLFDNMSDDEKYEWLDMMYIKMKKMNMYKHIRLGRYLKAYGVSEKGLKLFYRSFHKYLVHRMDYEIYEDLKQKFELH